MQHHRLLSAKILKQRFRKNTDNDARASTMRFFPDLPVVARTVPRDKVRELAAAVAQGDRSLTEGVNGFVHLVAHHQLSITVAPEILDVIADAITTDGVLRARFNALFRRLGSAH
jgi:hypothetical protein